MPAALFWNGAMHPLCPLTWRQTRMKLWPLLLKSCLESAGWQKLLQAMSKAGARNLYMQPRPSPSAGCLHTRKSACNKGRPMPGQVRALFVVDPRLPVSFARS